MHVSLQASLSNEVFRTGLPKGFISLTKEILLSFLESHFPVEVHRQVQQQQCLCPLYSMYACSLCGDTHSTFPCSVFAAPLCVYTLKLEKSVYSCNWQVCTTPCPCALSYMFVCVCVFDNLTKPPCVMCNHSMHTHVLTCSCTYTLTNAPALIFKYSTNAYVCTVNWSFARYVCTCVHV